MERFGERFGDAAFQFSKRRRARATSNLEMAMPELSATERHTIVRQMFRHFGRVAGDFLRSPLRDSEELLASVEVNGIETLMDSVALGRGVIVVSGHFGNWERLGHWFAAAGFPMTLVVRDANDSEMSDRVNEIRKSTGVDVLSRGNAARGILSKLRAGEIVGILADQNCDENFIPFFGKLCGTVAGPAVIAERTQSPILPVFCTYVGIGRYRIDIGQPIEPVPGFERQEGTMRAVNNALEQAIRQRPEQWLWMHDRWKSARRRGLL